MTPATRHRLRRMSVAGQAAMLLLGLAWAFCERPAPLIYIVWKTGLTPQARQEAETEIGRAHV